MGEVLDKLVRKKVPQSLESFTNAARDDPAANAHDASAEPGGAVQVQFSVIHDRVRVAISPKLDSLHADPEPDRLLVQHCDKGLAPREHVRALIQGVEVPRTVPWGWVARFLVHHDLFLYILLVRD